MKRFNGTKRGSSGLSCEKKKYICRKILKTINLECIVHWVVVISYNNIIVFIAGVKRCVITCIGVTLTLYNPVNHHKAR